MSTNPVIRPKLATPAIILASVVVFVAAAMFLSTLLNGVPSDTLMLGGPLLSLAVGAIGAVWLTRIRRRRIWTRAAEEKWNHFESARQRHRTTTEITVLSVDALEPTGSWITIRWNRFDHVQRAWIEALPDPIWPGSVVLISPDPVQVGPGQPWPQTYFIRASDLLAWAPPRNPISRLRNLPEQAQR
jgi:hypothetical protein